jgi:hypothetical protein
MSRLVEIPNSSQASMREAVAQFLQVQVSEDAG